MPKFYITTPLYYVNDKPHIGHAYTTILADVLARYQKNNGNDVYFLTGTDEHGQKVQEAANKRGVNPLSHVNEFVKRFESLWRKLGIEYDDFIRTTELRHINRVKELLSFLHNKGEIYSAEYEGLYSVSEERFITEKEYEEGSFREIKKLNERNYFFKMSNYQDALVEHINNNPDFIKPETRKNEILGFLKKPLNDLCISRPKSRLSWGIEIPFDKDYVTYVWFDALMNYINAVGWNIDDKKFNEWWPAEYHLIGKDILTTHAVYWSTMLLAADLPLPKTILAHGWWLIGEDKISKSLGNAVNPLDLIDNYGVDSVRYFLMRDMVLGNDANFYMESFIKRYNSDLANDYGNLVNRVTMLIHKNFGGLIPISGDYDKLDFSVLEKAKNTPNKVRKNFNLLKIHDAIENILSLIRELNRYLEKREPWKLVKSDKSQASIAATTLAISADILRISSQLLNPVMPEKTKDILGILGCDRISVNNTEIGLLKAGTKLGKGQSPFPRIEIKL